ncbi:MAG: glycosyltransferase 87 family protein [bacterium]
MIDPRRLTSVVLLVLVIFYMATVLSGQVSFEYFSKPVTLIWFGIIPLLLVLVYIVTSSLQKVSNWLPTAIVACLIILLLGTSFTQQILSRRSVENTQLFDQEKFTQVVHDGAVQTEEASRFLRAGENPYSSDYSQTAFGNYPDSFSGNQKPNPAYKHYVYLPATFLIVLPFQSLAEQASGWFDVRIIYYLGWFGLLVLLACLVKPPYRDLALVLVAFNPFIIKFIVVGLNDYLMLLYLVAAVALLQKKHLCWSGILLVLALASKQSAWLFLPFFVVSLVKALPGISWARRVKPLLPGIILGLLLVLPFVIWSAADFTSDVWGYANGWTEASYPASGLGLGQWLVTFQALDSAYDAFPFWVFSVIIGLPVMIWSMRRQWRENNPANLLWHYGITLLAFWLVARYFNDSHLSFIIVVLTIAVFLSSEPFESAISKPKAINEPDKQ